AVLDALLSELSTSAQDLGAHPRRNAISPYVSHVISEAPRVFMIRIASSYLSRSDQSSYSPNGTRNGPASLVRGRRPATSRPRRRPTESWKLRQSAPGVSQLDLAARRACRRRTPQVDSCSTPADDPNLSDPSRSRLM